MTKHFFVFETKTQKRGTPSKNRWGSFAFKIYKPTPLEGDFLIRGMQFTRKSTKQGA